RAGAGASRGGADELRVRAAGIISAEDGASRDEELGAGLAEASDVVELDPAVDLDEDVLGQQLAQAAHATVRLVEQLLARVARVDGHAERKLRTGGDGRRDRVLHTRLWIEGEPDAEPEPAGEGGRSLRVVGRLEVERDA